jgi:primosomal replication protein N
MPRYRKPNYTPRQIRWGLLVQSLGVDTKIVLGGDNETIQLNKTTHITDSEWNKIFSEGKEMFISPKSPSQTVKSNSAKPQTQNITYACKLIGNVGAEPELRFTPSGTAVCNLSLACYAGKSPEGEKLTQWVKLVTWKEVAELISKKVKTGDKLEVKGNSPTINEWAKQDGSIVNSLEMTVWEFAVLPKPAPKPE